MSLLVNVFLVGPLNPGASVTLPHGLKDNRGKLVPTQIMPNIATPIIVASANDTTATFTNTGSSQTFAAFRCEFDHSIHAVGAAPLYWQGVLGGTSGFTPVYGSFSDSTQQPLPASPATTLVSFNTDELLGGVTCVDNGTGKRTRLTVPTTGIYAFDLSPQLEHSGGGNENISFWGAINGAAIPRSASTLDMGNNNTANLTFIRLCAAMTAGQYFEWVFNSIGGTNIYLGAGLPIPPRPAIPSVIANVQRIA